MLSINPFAVSAMTLLVWRQEEHPACKKLTDELLVLSFVWREKQITYGPADANATLASLASLKSL